MRTSAKKREPSEDERVAAIGEREMKDYSPFNSDYFERWLALYRQVAAELYGITEIPDAGLH